MLGVKRAVWRATLAIRNTQRAQFQQPNVKVIPD